MGSRGKNSKFLGWPNIHPNNGLDRLGVALQERASTLGTARLECPNKPFPCYADNEVDGAAEGDVIEREDDLGEEEGVDLTVDGERPLVDLKQVIFRYANSKSTLTETNYRFCWAQHKIYYCQTCV